LAKLKLFDLTFIPAKNNMNLLGTIRASSCIGLLIARLAGITPTFEDFEARTTDYLVLAPQFMQEQHILIKRD
jgi:hypothetical protein